ncbi:MAG: esterase-like activity of phytase family protein [Gammaproteobacteria bacterium]|nr:MAG: esterase-like activity of phytase family protein [Gammaproteobacteria bacterium]
MKKLFRPAPLAAALCALTLGAQAEPHYLQRVSVFPVCENLEAGCNDDTETVAEIVVASENGKVLAYTDSQREALGFINIADPSNPKPDGVLPLSGEPTSVDVRGKYAYVAVNTSEGDVLPGTEDADAPIKFTREMSGELWVVDMHTHQVIQAIELSGQPDSVAISPNGQFVAIAIENERNEDVCVGGTYNGQEMDEDDCEAAGGLLGIPGQGPAGVLDIVDLTGKPGTWEKRTVDLAGLPGMLYPEDPEPEYVDINKDNVAVLTFQENNHIALIDLINGEVLDHYSAGSANLEMIDTKEEDPALISLTDTEDDVLHEPDGVTWISRHIFATANEGDLDGGSRGFSVLDDMGNELFNSGNSNDHLTVRLGHYPDGRSKNKGNEPENAEYVEFDDGSKLLAVCSERASLVFIYDVVDPANPVLLQTLPAGIGPEGVKGIPGRNLLVSASEEDNRDDKVRSVVNIYQYGFEAPAYPTIQSANRPDGTPIPWAALSGLAAESNETAYTIYDSFYQQSRIFGIDLTQTPALIDREIVLVDSEDVLAGLTTDDINNPDDVFDSSDLDAMINDDKTVNLDPEGIAIASDGGFWIASEGSGTWNDAGRPINSLNLIVKADIDGNITQVITLPADINAKQLRFGFEGVAEYDGKLYVAFQRAWSGLGDSMPRIGIYDLSEESWSFLFYPLDAVESPNGGWVGLSELTSLGNGQFMTVERDNQAGPDAAVKRLYTFDINGLEDGATVSKVLVRDLLSDLRAPGGLILEKIEGAAALPNGDVLIVNDNDGVDDSNGETQLINLGQILN